MCVRERERGCVRELRVSKLCVCERELCVGGRRRGEEEEEEAEEAERTGVHTKTRTPQRCG